METGRSIGYQDRIALDIEIDPRDREDFALGYYPGFIEIDTIDSGQFKDRVCLTTILERLSDNTYWSFQWSEAIETPGTEGNDYNMDNYMHKIRRVQIGEAWRVVDWVRVKN